MLSLRLFVPTLAVFFASITTSAHAAEDRPANVVLIMTDNHGAWTLGCYGNPDIRTPNIDRLATEGTLFDRAFASNPVCSPTRATFLTGLMPSQHGVHCFLTGGRLQVGPQARNTLDQITSLPEVLRDAGYACGLVGKWHLGDNLRPQEGFDDYWITMPHGGTSTFYDARVIEDGQIRNEPTYLTQFWTDHAVRFLKQRSQPEQPFFLFLAYNGPYSLSRLLLRDGQNRHAEYYADKTLPSFPRQPTHPWQFSNRDYHNNPVSIRRVATEISGIDDGVGTVMASLQELGLDENTVVVFVADQGWAGGHGGFFGMGDHTRPVTAHDEMMKIPMIWRHPERIQSGARSDALVSNYDVMPTLLSYLGMQDRMPTAPQSPGIDFSQELINPVANKSNAEIAHDAVFYEFEALRCIRTERWKYVHRHPNGPHELYDLSTDHEEFKNLYGAVEHADVTAELKRRLDAFFDEHAVPKYDMYHGGGSQAKLFVGIDEETSQVAAVPPPPTPDGYQPADLRVPDGFTAELVAGPPLVTHPTMGCFDDSGRLFICNNAGVNLSAEELEKELPNEIRMLEDTDGDGRFDTATVFADKMTYPMGGAWHDGALYVASPPHIWRLEDTDDDGVADKRQQIVSEFGYTGNAASIHGCFNGPDGRVYWCDGFHGHQISDAEGNVASERKGSYLFSCLPDGSDVRIHCGGGMDNPVEVDFTDEGDMIGTVNILRTRPRVDALVHWLYGGAYPHRERVLEELKTTGDWLGPIHRFGHVAVSGTLRYRSGAIDHRWRDNFFATHFNSGKVVRLELETKGSTYAVRQREFLSGTSPDFHPTDVIEDADGSLLVVDTGGWFYRGCPTSQMSKPDVLGGIYRVRRDGMTPQVDPWGLKIDWSQQTESQLIKLLNDTRHPVRERAIDECAMRGAAVVPRLAAAVRRSDIRVRQNALWALTRIAGNTPGLESAKRGLVLGLDDADASVRQTACRALATYPAANAMPKLVTRLSDSDPAVRREAAKALGRLGNDDAVKPLLDRLGAAEELDRSEEHAVLFALIEIDAPERTVAGLKHASANVRRGCLIALDQMDTAELSWSQIIEQLRAEDADLQQTAAKILSRRIAELSDRDSADDAVKLASVAVSESIEDWFRNERSESDWAVATVSALAGEPPVAEKLGQLLTAGEFGPTQSAAFKAISAAGKVTPPPSWREAITRWLQSDDPQAVRHAIDASAKVTDEQITALLQTISEDPHQDGTLRVAALRVVGRGNAALSDEAFVSLMQMLSGGVALESDQAAEMLASSQLSVDQLKSLAERFEGLGPSALRILIRPFASRRSPELANDFLDHVESARAFEQLPTTEFSDVIKRFPAESLPRANALLDRLKQLDQQRIATIDRLIPRVADADAQRGREVFFAEKSKCATCHRVGEQGGLVGPDLTTIGRNRSQNDLLESILFPSASIVRQYESQTLMTDAGQVYTGIIARETSDTVYLQQQTGDPIAIARDEIEQIVPSTVSIMPKGLDASLGEQELADLVAWLTTLGKDD